jgi:hypothetical protein
MRKLSTIQVTLAVAGLLACSGYDASSPYGGGGGGGGDGGGGGGGNTVGAVTVGPGIQFTSRHNGSSNLAVDTISVGGTATWTWSGTLPHSVKSVGTASFASSGTLTGSGTYAVTFATAGTYQYECAVHGQAMTGTIVVMPVSSNSRATVATR